MELLDYKEEIYNIIMSINDKKILKCILFFVKDIKKECA